MPLLVVVLLAAEGSSALLQLPPRRPPSVKLNTAYGGENMSAGVFIARPYTRKWCAPRVRSTPRCVTGQQPLWPGFIEEKSGARGGRSL